MIWFKLAAILFGLFIVAMLLITWRMPREDDDSEHRFPGGPQW